MFVGWLVLCDVRAMCRACVVIAMRFQRGVLILSAVLGVYVCIVCGGYVVRVVCVLCALFMLFMLFVLFVCVVCALCALCVLLCVLYL